MGRYQSKSKNRKHKRLRVIFITVFFLFYLAVPALAESIQELEKQKENSQKAIEEAQYVVDQEQTTIDSIEKELVTSNNTIQALEQEIGPLNEQVSQTSQELTEAQAKLESLVSQEQEQQDLMEDRMRVSYMYGDEGYTEAIFNGDTVTEQMENSEIVGDVLEADREMLDELDSSKQETQQARSELENKKRELDTQKSALDAKLDQQQELKQQQQELLEKNQQLIDQAKQEIAAEEASIAEANKKIQDLTEKAEREALEAQRREIKRIYSQAESARDDTALINNEINASFASNEDADIQALVNEIQGYADAAVIQTEKISTLVSTADGAATASEAVQACQQADSLLSVVYENKAAASDAKARITALDLEKKKQQAEEAARNAEAARQAEAQRAAEQAAEQARQAEYAAQEARSTAQAQSSKSFSSTDTSTWEGGNVSSSGWRWPLDGIFDITSVFGYRIHPIFGTGRGHEGIDIGADTGTPIHACDGGRVIYAGENGGYGNCVIVQQNSGHQVYYAHQSEIKVNVGDTVNKGDVIGLVGSTGWSTGPHLHLGVMSGTTFIDPFQFFPEVENMQ